MPNSCIIFCHTIVFRCRILFVGYLHVYFPKKDNPTCTFGTSSKDLVKSSSSIPPDWPKNRIKKIINKSKIERIKHIMLILGVESTKQFRMKTLEKDSCIIKEWVIIWEKIRRFCANSTRCADIKLLMFFFFINTKTGCFVEVSILHRCQKSSKQQKQQPQEPRVIHWIRGCPKPCFNLT